MNLTVFCEVLTRGDDEPTYARSISLCIFAVEYAVPVWPSGTAWGSHHQSDFSKDAKFLHFGAVGFRKFVAHDQCPLYLKKIVKCLSIECLRELLAVH